METFVLLCCDANALQASFSASLGQGCPHACWHACLQDGRDVAVKVFKGETSPDGQASDEIAVTCHVDHPNLSKYASRNARPDDWSWACSQCSSIHHRA